MVDQDNETLALTRTVHGLAKKIVDQNETLGDEFEVALANMEDPKPVSDFTTAYFVRDYKERQRLLELSSIRDRLMLVAEILTRELDLLELGKKIQDQLKEKIEKSQREYFLREQMKAIRTELGEEVDEQTLEFEKYKKLIDEAGMPDAAKEKAEQELDRLMRMAMESAESSVIRNYLDWLTSLPWSKGTEDNDGHPRGRGYPRAGSPRPCRGEGPHSRVPGGAQAQARPPGLDHLLRRAAGHG